MKKAKRKLIQLALFDPCGDNDPVAFIDRPRKDRKKTRRLFAEVIRRFNQVPDTNNVVAVVRVRNAVGVFRKGLCRVVQVIPHGIDQG